MLEIDKAPVDWYWRPGAWPVSNHRIQRPPAETLRLPAPPHTEAAEQLATELEASLTHLRSVRDAYWQHNWCRENRGLGLDPEDHLWNAVHGYLDLLEAVQSQT